MRRGAFEFGFEFGFDFDVFELAFGFAFEEEGLDEEAEGLCFLNGAEDKEGSFRFLEGCVGVGVGFDIVRLLGYCRVRRTSELRSKERTTMNCGAAFKKSSRADDHMRA